MAPPAEMETLDARLASFENAIPGPKRRGSNAKGQKVKGWPHQTPTIRELADAGFYYTPTASHPDNTTCFQCDSQIDGWEEGDEPAAEHLKLSTSCAWAIVQNVALGSKEPADMEDPTGDRLFQARKATFKLRWPHENKRGWVCKAEKMAATGWHFAPTSDSEDFVSCAYCNLSMDGWEPKDCPFDEHYRRAPGCPFFVFAGTSAPKGGRGRKSRASKASRLSTQSNATVESQAPSIPDLDESIDGSDDSQSTVLSVTSTMATKKGTKGKGRSNKTKQRESTTSAVNESATTLSHPVHRGKKRKSDDISDDGRAGRESTVKPEPPAKRRVTRSRASEVQDVDYPVLEEDKAIPSKAGQKGRKRASTRSGKISATAEATAAIASKAALLRDEEIEAALEADLDREMEDQTPTEADHTQDAPKPKTKGSGKKVAGTKAAPRNTKRITSESEAGQDHAPDVEMTIAEPQDEQEEKPRGKGKGRKKNTTKKEEEEEKAAAANEASAVSTTAPAKNIEDTIDSSMMTAQSTLDDSGHETDASVASQRTVTRKGSKKKRTSRVKGKKTGAASKNIEDILQAKAEVPADLELPLPAQLDIEPTLPEKPEPKKAAKGKAKSKAVSKKSKVPQLSMPGMFSPLMGDMDPSFSSVLAPSSPLIIPTQVGLGADQRIPFGLARSSSPKMRGKKSTPHNLSTFIRSPSPETQEQPNTTPRRTKQAPSRSTPSPSPQASDAENQPPSSLRPSARPPLAPVSPNKELHFAPGTPSRATPSRKLVQLSPTKIRGGLQSSAPWTCVDVEMIFAPSSPDKENDILSGLRTAELTSPERKMTVEQWISAQAIGAEEKLRLEAERVVGVFEREGGRALRALEGIEVIE